MNIHLRWLPLLVCAWFACSTDALADDQPAVAGSWQVRGDVQIIRLPTLRAVPIITRFADDARGADAELQRLLADGTATLAHHITARTSDGLPYETTIGEAIRYPTEFSMNDPGTIPRTRRGEKPAATSTPATAFEVSQSGPSFEFTPTVAPNGVLVHAAVSLGITDYSGLQRFEGGVAADGTRVFYEQPVFFHRRNHTNVIVHFGEPILIGCCALASDRHTAELQILRIRARRSDGAPQVREAAPGTADAPDAQKAGEWPAQSRLETFRFIVPESDALRIRPALFDTRRSAKAFEELLAAVRTGKAELAEVFSCPGRMGDITQFENLRAQKYGTEFTGGCGLFGAPVNPPTLGSPAMPMTVFERRDVGDVLEFDLEQRATKQLGLRLDLKTTEMHGFNRWPAGPDVVPPRWFVLAKSYWFQPNFTESKTMTNIVLTDRVRTLLRFQKLSAPDERAGRVEIVIARAITEILTEKPKP